MSPCAWSNSIANIDEIAVKDNIWTFLYIFYFLTVRRIVCHQWFQMFLANDWNEAHRSGALLKTPKNSIEFMVFKNLIWSLLQLISKDCIADKGLHCWIAFGHGPWSGEFGKMQNKFPYNDKFSVVEQPLFVSFSMLCLYCVDIKTWYYQV